MTTLKSIISYSLFLLIAINNANGQTNSPANTYWLQANDFKKNMKQDSAIVYFEKASIEFQNEGNIEKFVDAYNQIGIILTRQDNYEKAKTYLNKALSVGLSNLDSTNLFIATTYISLGVIYNAEENYDQSLNCHYKALGIRMLKLGENSGEVATSYGNLGNVYRNNKDFEKSVEAHLKAMKIREKVYGLSSAEIIESYVGLGNAYREKKEYTISLEYFEKALKNKISQRGEGHKDLGRFYKYISEVYYLNDNKLKGDEYKSAWEVIEKKIKLII